MFLVRKRGVLSFESPLVWFGVWWVGSLVLGWGVCGWFLFLTHGYSLHQSRFRVFQTPFVSLVAESGTNN